MINQENEKHLKGFKADEPLFDEQQAAASEEPTQKNSLQVELDTCKAEQAEWKERAMRLTADLENYKKRMSKEQSYWMQRAQATTLESLLPIIDNFDRAMEHLKDNEGIVMIHNSFHDFLKKVGVEEVAYEYFDPNQHEALMQLESPDHESGAIVQVLEKGYKIGDHVLRPAKVSVAK